ncbi:FlaD/FlaE family flagellar protein [Halorientalis sp.]|uniref:FlaD/FlaE family flagellar protein n=1 Tax=Halorientalis sp. TaxID=1931229 RepID=UPI0032C24737
MSGPVAGPVAVVLATGAEGLVPDGLGPLVALVASGAVGMSIKNVFDSILSDEEEEGELSGDVGDDMGGDGGLMTEEGDDDLDDLGGLGGDDDIGGFDDGDGFGDMDGGGGGGPATDELENRLDELENEVGSLQSTVNTVRNENEQIGEQVQDLDENIRKLLDIYEMVTRGVNPFADDIQSGAGGGGLDEGSFGLFNDDDDDDEEEIDDEIANADAEGFFDEDLVEEESDDVEGVGDDFGGASDVVDGGADDGEEMGEFDDGGDDFGDMSDFDDGGDDFGDMGDFDDGGDDFGDMGEFDDGGDDFGDMGDSGDDSDGGDDGDGGKSFQELKQEYESGDADWAEGEEPEPEAEAMSDEDELAGLDDGAAADEEPVVEPADDLDGGTVEAVGDGLGGMDGEFDDGAAADEMGGSVVESSDVDDVLPSAGEDDGEAGLGAEPEPEPELDTEPEPEPELDTEPEPEPELDTEPEPEPELDTEPESDPEPATTTTEATETEQVSEAGTDDSAASDDEPGKPYLRALPDGYAADLIVMEWLEYLVSQSGVRETTEAIQYYERIDWLSESVAGELRSFLSGYDGGGAGGSLTIDHHTQSLRYISQLGEDVADGAAMRLLARGGGGDGLQR